MLHLSQMPSSAEQDAARRRRLSRMISNRESARRSRLRKHQHLEDLLFQAARLRAQNRELSAVLGLTAHQVSLYRAPNDELRCQSSALHGRLSEIRRILFLRQLQRLSLPAANCGSFGCSGNEQTLSSLIA